jgi:hypothetical protein
MAECRDWDAWYNRMPGTNDPELHVSGTCGLPSSQAKASLELGNIGIYPEPGAIALDLTVEEPPVGDTQYVEREVSWSGDLGPDIQTVLIRGDADAQVSVRIVE